MPYIPIPIETEPIDLADEAFDYIIGAVPGWTPAAGGLEEILVEALSQLAGELRDLAQLVPDAIFQYWGASIMGLPPYEAVQAVTTTTWTMRDLDGYRVNAGTLIAIEPPASTDTFAFEVINDFVVPSGNQTISGVGVRALEAGAAASGITGDVEMIDVLDFVESVVLDGPTSGGQEAEDTAHYLDRLSDLLTLLSPRLILPNDYAVYAARMFPAVGRATAIDLLNPETNQTNVPRCVTVAVVGTDGQPLSQPIKDEIRAGLQAQRETTFLVFVIDPTYTTIDVTWQAVSFPTFNPAEVTGRVNEALTSYLTASNWGMPPFGDPATVISWINETTVRHNELIALIDRVEGVNFVEWVTLARDGGAQSANDVPMEGWAPMPTPGTIAGECVPSA